MTLAALLVSKAFSWNKKEVVTNSFYKDLPQNRLSARANKIWNDLLRLLRIKPSQMKFLPSSESAAFFDERFALAFPGIRSITWFEGKEAVTRLKLLLQEPLVFKGEGNSITTPIWWWKGFGDLQISKFKVLDKETILMNNKELLINKIAAVYSGSYKQLFVYVEAKAMSPTGVYEWNDELIKSSIACTGYAKEEYSIYKKKHFLTREEHDDGAAIIKGKHVRLYGEDELRERFLSPYNFVIAPHDSPINNLKFDEILDESLNGILTGVITVEDLKCHVAQLPNARIHRQSSI